MEEKWWFYLLRLLRYDLFKIFNFDFRFEQEVKVKLGHFFYQYFLTIVVHEIWFLNILNLYLM